MKVLVTGGAGFVGAHLCRHLAESGTEVVAIDVHAQPDALQLEGIRYRQADLRRLASWAPDLDGVSTVFHLASIHLQVRSDAAEYRAVNVDASAALAAACADRKVERMVHVSTVGIYGHVASPPADEDAPRQPSNPYERTKLEGEMAVARVADERGIDLRILRPAWVYGPGCPRTRKLFRSIQRGRFAYIGSGRNLRHPVYVGDVVDALLAASRTPPGSRRDHLIAGPRSMPLRELVESFARALGVTPPWLRLPRPVAVALGLAAEGAGTLLRREPPISRRSLAFFENDNAFDIRAAQRDLGFTPRVDLPEGLERTLRDSTWPLRL
jgi:nucleoside-diphosphate-sugar epimerase